MIWDFRNKTISILLSINILFLSLVPSYHSHKPFSNNKSCDATYKLLSKTHFWDYSNFDIHAHTEHNCPIKIFFQYFSSIFILKNLIHHDNQFSSLYFNYHNFIFFKSQSFNTINSRAPPIFLM